MSGKHSLLGAPGKGLNFAQQYSMNAGSRKQASDAIYAVQRYCQEHIASQVPQWQLIA